MASIRTYTTTTGKRRYQAYVRRRGFSPASATFGRRLDAEAWARNLELQLAASASVTPTTRPHTLCEAIAEHVARYDRRYSRGWNRTRHAALRRWAERLGALALDDITPAMLEHVRDELLSDGLAASTANRYLAALSAVYQRAVRVWRWATSNPCRLLDPLREEPARAEYLTPAEANRLLLAAAPGLRPWIILALSTGARRGSLSKLDWSDVSLARGVLTLRLTKNGHDITLPIVAPARQVLTDLKGSRSRRDGMVLGTFPRRAWERARRSIGRPRLRFHDLRHTTASWLGTAGASLPQIGAILGHGSTETTMRYTHFTGDHQSALLSAATASLVVPPCASQPSHTP